ncbi:hypothetical protein RBB78_15270 [Tunturiibacter empetritectus]|uniref:hypothetical protein n=1 Tax=Tunturiibacter empetritectus TaxID=3069691 RepID=UPI003D9BD107
MPVLEGCGGVVSDGAATGRSSAMMPRMRRRRFCEGVVVWKKSPKRPPVLPPTKKERSQNSA